MSPLTSILARSPGLSLAASLAAFVRIAAFAVAAVLVLALVLAFVVRWRAGDAHDLYAMADTRTSA